MSEMIYKNSLRIAHVYPTHRIKTTQQHLRNFCGISPGSQAMTLASQGRRETWREAKPRGQPTHSPSHKTNLPAVASARGRCQDNPPIPTTKSDPTVKTSTPVLILTVLFCGLSTSRKLSRPPQGGVVRP